MLVRATNARAWREQAEFFERATHAVESHWYDMPYASRERLCELAEQIDRRAKEPRSLSDWARIARGAGSIAWSYLSAEDYVVRWAFAYAKFLVALQQRTVAERVDDERAWAEAMTDTAFREAHERGEAAYAAGAERVTVDWATFQKTTP